jgi:LacI family transcriptional regulator
MITRNDVAHYANVSGATVSRVFNHPDQVSTETIKLVIDAAEALHYHPNAIAQHFVRGTTGNLGVLIPWYPKVHLFSSYYFSELLSGIGKAIEHTNYDLMLTFYNREKNGVDFEPYFKRNKVDGFVILGSTLEDTSLIELYKKNYQFCLINHRVDNSAISYVDVDHYLSATIATSHLHELGCQTIGFLNGLPHYRNSIDRYNGYKDTLAQLGLSLVSEHLFEGNYGFKSGYHTAQKILAQQNPPEGIFCANDRMAAGLLRGLVEAGKLIPQDMRIIGCDNLDIGRITWPTLSTLHVPLFEMGYRCATLFLSQLNSPAYEPFTHIFKPELIVRQSST